MLHLRKKRGEISLVHQALTIPVDEAQDGREEVYCFMVRQSNAAFRSLRIVSVIAAVSLAVSTYLFFQTKSTHLLSVIGGVQNGSSSTTRNNYNILQRNALDEKTTTVQKGWVDNVEYIWQFPVGGRKAIVAILFVAHGCKHSATDWWPSSIVCPECLGLPEELAIVQNAREHGMIVVSVSSKDRLQKCWRKSDGPRVAKVLDQIHDSFGVHLPIFGFGSSSGAEMVGYILPNAMSALDKDTLRLCGIISQNKVPNDHYDRDIPATYITLPHGGLATKLDDYVARKRKGPTKLIHLPPSVIGPLYFYDRMPDKRLSMETSQQIYEQLSQAKLIDETGAVLKDPKTKTKVWQPLLAPLVMNDTLIPDESAVFEIYNMAYGHHQTTRDGVNDALDWLLITHAHHHIDKSLRTSGNSPS